ncbi:MAG: hypothetical protein FWH20_06130 [Oscillospiraceae bacterium]|nr:hypothetical protein [Oscillospiraceae bacterium]
MTDKINEEAKKLAARGREKGRVLHFTEAFKKYPTENECHKGDIKFFK